MEGERRIVLLGKTGSGKSSLANTIFGENVFKVGHTFQSETRKCRAETRDVQGRRLTLIDTPGFFDTDRPEEELRPEIVKCIIECAPGPHAFLIVLKVERFTEHEKDVIEKIRNHFTDEALKYAVVIFTYGDQLECEKIEDLVNEYKCVKDLVEKCGGRCHVFDNKYWKNKQQDEYRSNQFQVGELLSTLESMVEENKGSCYTNEMLKKVSEMMQEEEACIRSGSNTVLREVEIKMEAKNRTCQKLLKIFAGIAIGALLGGLLGAVAGVLCHLQNQTGNLSVSAAVGAAGGIVLGGGFGYKQGVEADSVGEAITNTAMAIADMCLKKAAQYSKTL